MDLLQKKERFREILKKSRMYPHMEEPVRVRLLAAVDKATDEQLNGMVVQFDQGERELAAIDQEIADADAKKKQLEEQKKKFMAELELNIKKDASDSAKKAEEILAELKSI